MSDQLSLSLEAGLPNLPDLRPMLPRTVTEPFDSIDHVFEPAWGGVRALAFVGPGDAPGTGAVRLVGLDGEELAGRLPELAGMAARVVARSAVLDGELVVVDSLGRSDASELGARLHGRSGRPVAFLAFDLLHLDGRSLIGQSLTRRRDALRRVLRPGDEVVAVPAFPTEGRALFEAAAAQGIAGVMARHRASPYLPGVRSRLWRFVPCAPRPVDAEAAAADGLEVGDGAASSEPRTAGRVMALIRRLPLQLEDAE